MLNCHILIFNLISGIEDNFNEQVTKILADIKWIILEIIINFRFKFIYNLILFNFFSFF